MPNHQAQETHFPKSDEERRKSRGIESIDKVARSREESSRELFGRLYGVLVFDLCCNLSLWSYHLHLTRTDRIKT